MAHYLVTGGCGFIGSHLVAALYRDGHRITVLDDLSSGKRNAIPPEVTLIEGTIENPTIVAKAMRDQDGCFHLAAIASVRRASEAWLSTHRTNLSGTIAIFEAAITARSDGRKVPVVYASSAAVYGDQTELPLQETARLQPLSAYGADKIGAEMHGKIASLIHGVPVLGLRFFNVYGPRQDPESPYSGVITRFCNQLWQQLPLSILGDGGQTRDFIYIDDVVAALRAGLARLEKNKVVIDNGAINVASGEATSIRELAHLLIEITGRKVPINFAPPRSDDIRYSVAAITRMKNELGLYHLISLAEGLRTLWSTFETF